MYLCNRTSHKISRGIFKIPIVPYFLIQLHRYHAIFLANIFEVTTTWLWKSQKKQIFADQSNKILTDFDICSTKITFMANPSNTKPLFFTRLTWVKSHGSKVSGLLGSKKSTKRAKKVKRPFNFWILPYSGHKRTIKVTVARTNHMKFCLI